MDNEKIDVSKDILEKDTIEKLAELKVEVDDLSTRLDNIIENCDDIINS